MFYVLQNEAVAARRRVPILLTDSATGTTAQSGVALTNIYAYVNINGGAFIGGTGSVGEAGFGQYYYQFEANEVATLGLAGIHVTAAGCRDYDAIAQIAAFNVYSSGGVGISAYDVWQFDASIFTNFTEAGGLLNAAYLSASSADSNANAANNQTVNIPGQVWGEDLAASANAPYAAGSAGTTLYTLGQGGGGISAYDVWAFDYINAPGGVVVGSSAERLEETRTEAYSANNNTNIIIGAQYPISDIWQWDSSTNTDPSVGYNLYQLGIGATGYAAGGGITAGDVWSYVDRTITGGIADTVQLVSTPVDVSTASMSGIANSVWDFVITGFGQTGSAAVYSTQTLFTAGNIETYVANQTPQDVWTYSGIEGRTITGGLADTVTTLTNRAGFSITGGTIDVVNDKTGYSLSSSQTFDLTGNITGNVSGSVGSVTNPVSVATTSMTGIAGSVWNSLTSAYSTNGTYGLNILRADQANKVGDVTLYSSGGVNGVDADIHRIANDTAAATSLKNILTGVGGETLTANITGNLSGSVNSVTSPVSVSTASMSGIANTVWATDISGYTAPSAGYDLANVSGAGLTAGDVWTYDVTLLPANTTAGGNLFSTYATVGTNLNDTITNIPGLVWSEDVANSSYGAGTAGTLLYDASLSGGSGISAADVWSYATRTITGGIADTVTTLTDRSGFAITGGTVDTVTNGVTVTTNNDKTGYSLSGTQSFNLTGNITGNLSGSVGSVSGNVSGSVNSVLSDVPVNEALISADVWGYATRTLTSGAGISAADVWSYATRTVTGGTIDNANVTSVGSTAQAGIANSVWRYQIEGALPLFDAGTAGYELDFVGANVWSEVINGYFGNSESAASYMLRASSSIGNTPGNVWSYATRTLTSGGSGISAYDVWNFVLSDTNTAEADLISAASGGAGISAGDVWSYGSRTITGGLADTVTTVTNRSGFAVTGGTVDTVTNGVTVSTNNDKSGYALSTAGVNAVQSGLSTLTQAQVGTEVDASLSDVGLTSTVTGRIDVAVSSRLASASYTAPPTEAAIAGTVWSYGSRTLTSGAGATAGDVWTYPTRSLTSGAGITVNAATNIINGPYFVKSNVDGQDNTLDVIRGMVQDIQLTVTDAFGNPFDTTALGLAVNFYDQAGTLTTSYGTTELYGPAGLVQFTLDTAVTANEGRYNLILSAAGSGNTIKFGPLQTLVRPF